MAIGILKGVDSGDSGVVMYHGKITFGSTTAITTDDSYGFAVTKAATGRIRVTLDHKHPEFLNFIAQLDSQAGAADNTYQIYNEYTAANGYFDISLLTGATETSPSSGDVLYLTVIMKKTTVQ